MNMQGIESLMSEEADKINELREQRDRLQEQNKALVEALRTITSMVEVHSGHPMSNDKRTKDARALLAEIDQ